MHAHFVLAHPEPQSFNAHLVLAGSSALEAEGWTVSVSDLYAMGFDPCERPEHYLGRADTARFDTQVEQRHASEGGNLPKVVTDELWRLDRADLLVLQYPMWWHLPPAMLKGWFDRVLAYGAATLFGLATSVLRMAFGGHFFTDVAAAGLVTFLVIWLTHGLIYRWPQTRLPDAGIDAALTRLALPGYRLLRRRRSRRNAPPTARLVT